MEYLDRFRHASMPYQEWRPFPPDAIVHVKNCYGEGKIAQVKDLWWGMGYEFGSFSEGVIMKARRLDRPKER